MSTFAAGAERRIAFERSNAVYVANLDGSGEKKVAAGIFPAISPDAARVTFTTVEKTGETYIRHIAVADECVLLHVVARWKTRLVHAASQRALGNRLNGS